MDYFASGVILFHFYLSGVFISQSLKQGQAPLPIRPEPGDMTWGWRWEDEVQETALNVCALGPMFTLAESREGLPGDSDSEIHGNGSTNESNKSQRTKQRLQATGPK